MKAISTLKVLAGGVIISLALTGCTMGQSSSEPAPSDGPNVLRILAGSEVKDLEPILEQVESSTGVDIQMSYTGTLDGTQAVASGATTGKYDATWFPSNRYLALLDGGSAAIKEENKIMSSPVVLGVKPSKAAELGWNTTAPTWSDIVNAVNDGKLTYGMTSPVSSNSGFSALIEAATALSGTGDVLQSSDITAVAPQLTQLFAGQQLTAGSSGYLVDKFAANPDAVDAVFNYESVLTPLSVDESALDIVIPSDGVITADYPLTLLSSAPADKAGLYTKVSQELLTDSVQQRIAAETHRRTSTSGASASTAFELPFPNQLSTVQALLGTYLDKIKKPSDMVFQSDTSGSMAGDRIESLKDALTKLTDSGSEQNAFVSFQARETIDFVEFSDKIKSDKSFTVSETNPDQTLGQIRSYIQSLNTGGGTAIYDSLKVSYANALKLQRNNPDHFVSVTLFTDGENSDGGGLDDFTTWYNQQVKSDTGIQTIPTYVIVFGEGNSSELTRLAQLTGGKAFSASDSAKLPSVFKEIRGYQ